MYRAEISSPRRGQTNSGSSASQPEEIGKIMQHRLFQSWPPDAAEKEKSKENEKEKATALLPASPARRAPLPSPPVVPPIPPPVVTVILSDDDEGVPSNKLDLDPVDRVRRARHPDGSTSMVRVQGGWMRKHPLEGSPDPATSSDPGPLQLAENMKQRILAKAAARMTAAPSTNATSVLARRYKNDLIEAVVNNAKSSSNRHKFSFDVQRLAAALVASVEPVSAHVLAELRDTYQAKPCLFYVPLEDGGLRYGTASHANVPRSLHALCIANLMCGVCLNSTDDDLIMIQGSGENAYAPVIADKGKSKKSKKGYESKVQFVEPEMDRYNLVPLSCGAVTYSAHKQCAHEGERPLLDADTSDTKTYMELGAVHEYEQVDDADCDLCGRKGGLMRHFTIAAGSSSVPPPNEEGWLAHIPCVNFLHSSGLLRPLSEGTTGVFDDNLFSHRVGWTSASSDSAMEVEESTEETNAATIAESDANAVKIATVNTTTGAVSGNRSDGEDKAALLEEDRLHSHAPLSRFDQLHGRWRCTLCGLQTGVALRCAAAGCATRAHPLCVQACGDPDWRLCSAHATGDAEAGGVHGDALLVLCSLHSAPV